MSDERLTDARLAERIRAGETDSLGELYALRVDRARHRAAGRALRAVASADAAYSAVGEAGSGWVIKSGDEAMFMADDLADLAAGHLYELWLIDAEGNAVPAGTLTDTDGLALVTLEQPTKTVAFAVTVETERVEQSQNDPVIVAAIGA